jgi:hypothetical protein
LNSLYLLQRVVLPTLQSGNNPMQFVILGVVLLGFFILLALGARSGGGPKRPMGGSSGAKYSRSGFRKRANSVGLNQIQIRTLENLIKKYRIQNPMNLLNNSPLLDRILRKAMEEVNLLAAAEHVKDAQRLTLFHIKQIIERSAQKGTPISSSRELTINQSLVISPESGGRFQSRVTTNLRDVLGLKIPTNNQGAEVRWKKGSRLKIFFWKRNGQGYSFVSKITGYNIMKGIPSLFIQHVAKVTQEQQRRFRRKAVDRPAYFYPVRVITIGSGRKAQKKATVEKNRGALGSMKDISSGGCSVRSSYPLPSGSLVKLEFETNHRENVAAFGKVIRTRTIRPMGGQMHIMFTRVTKNNINKINAFVYDFEEEV